MGIDSLAMPALGCGNVGLNWNDVQPLIEKYLGSIVDLDVYVYQPQQTKIQADPSTKKQNAQLGFLINQQPSLRISNYQNFFYVFAIEYSCQNF